MSAALVLAAMMVGCGPAPATKEPPMTVRSIQETLATYRDSLMALPGVVGTAIGRCGDALCIRVFVIDADDAIRRAIPDTLEGHPVSVEVSGAFHAQ